MPRKGPIRFPEFVPPEEEERLRPQPTTVELPPRSVIDAGMKVFKEMAKLHWPDTKGGIKLTSFDIARTDQLQVTLGLVYMAMRKAEEGEP